MSFLALLCCPLLVIAACGTTDNKGATAKYDKTNVTFAAVIPIPGVTIPAVGGGWIDRDDAEMPLEGNNGDPIRSRIVSPDGSITEDAISMWGQSGGIIGAGGVGGAGEGEIDIEVDTLFITGGAALQHANGVRCRESRGSADVCNGEGIKSWETN